MGRSVQHTARQRAPQWSARSTHVTQVGHARVDRSSCSRTLSFCLAPARRRPSVRRITCPARAATARSKASFFTLMKVIWSRTRMPAVSSSGAMPLSVSSFCRSDGAHTFALSDVDEQLHEARTQRRFVGCLVPRRGRTSLAGGSSPRWRARPPGRASAARGGGASLSVQRGQGSARRGRAAAAPRLRRCVAASRLRATVWARCGLAGAAAARGCARAAPRLPSAATSPPRAPR